jgi:hypothetical protein
MKRPVAAEASPSAADASPSAADATGLPCFRTWRSVYLLVLASFALWVGLLIALTKLFS